MTKEQRREYMRKYRESDKYKAWISSEEYKEKRRKYWATGVGAASQKAKHSSPKYLASARERMAAYAQTPQGRFRSYWTGARQRGIEFSLSKEEFLSFWNKPCHYCGAGIETIGLDRVDNSAGYRRDNVVPCCQKCNRAKLNMSREEYLALCKRVVDHLKI